MIHLSPACIVCSTGKAYKLAFPTASKACECQFWMRESDVYHMGNVISLNIDNTWKYNVQRDVFDHYGDKTETKKSRVPGSSILFHMTTALDGSKIDLMDSKSWAPKPPPVLKAEPCNAINDLIDSECDDE